MKLSFWITDRTQFTRSIARLSEVFPQLQLIQDDRWDDVELIWKPVYYGPEYHKLPKLKYLSTHFTTANTLTEKLSLLETGLEIFGEEFFEIQPYGQSSRKARFDLPKDYLKKHPSLGSSDWITKPSNSWSGKGIKIFLNFDQVEAAFAKDKTPTIIQKYLEHPLLFQGRKFDLRLYILMTTDRILFYQDGFARVCPKAYQAPTGDSVQHDGIHLTNIAQNGLEDTRHLISELAHLGVSFQTIHDFVKKLTPIFNHAQKVEREYQKKNGIKFTTFELLGLDIIFDRDLRPWLLEINKDPASLPEPPIEQIVMNLMGDVFKEVLSPDKFKTGFIPL